ncbi:MAG: glycoside hydrolase N-terminal domain-containing protein [Clostridia bacterium]|nr:glycoside hydrolase N-terminal domain-containing protein [Clostridia bacterium]
MATIKKQANVLTSGKPAGWWGETWREGYFVGNGCVGANSFGGPADEKILINHADLQWQGRISVVPDVAFKLKETRKYIDNKQYNEASEVMVRALVSKNFRPQHFYPLPLCVLHAKNSIDKGVREYERTLNMGTAEATSSYLDGQTRVMRKLFVSRANDTVVYEITKTGGNKQLDVEFNFELIDAINARTVSSMSALPDNVKTVYDKYFMYFSARNDDGGDYGAVAKLNHYGGALSITEKGLRISGANSIIVYVKTFVKSTAEKEFARLKTELAALKDPYDKMLKTHVALHQKVFGGATLSFDTDTDQYIEDYLAQVDNGDLNPTLLEKYWKYARYLLACSTTDNGRLFTPYGLWCGSYKAYKSAIPYSGAIEEVYDYTLSANMLPLCESLFSFVDEHLGEYKENAMRLFGCRGIYIPTIPATNTGRLGALDVNAVHFTGCAGYIAKLYYEYYLLTGNTKLLKSRILPYLKEVVTFYEDYFKTNADGQYTSSPSVLPPVAVSTMGVQDTTVLGKDAYIDFAICKRVLTDLLSGAKELDIYKEDINRWEKMLSNLPTYEKNADGSIRDYTNGSQMGADDDANNSTLFLARTITRDESDYIDMHGELVATARRKLVEGACIQNSYSLTTLATQCAKLGQKKLAVDCLINVIRGCSMNNLALTSADWRGMGLCGSDTWVPMQLQSNITLANAINNMLIGTQDGRILILPCMPYDWPSFKAEDLQSYGGTQVTITHNAKFGTLQVDIKARKKVSFDMYLPDGTKKLNKCSIKNVKFDSELSCVQDISLDAGKSVSYLFAFKGLKN